MITSIGINETLQALRQLAQDLDDSTPRTQAMLGAARFAARYAASITHRLTGTLAGAHTAIIEGKDALVVIDPSATNPRTRQLASFYGPFEHEHGGIHAFYDRTIEEQGEQIIAEAEKGIDELIDGAMQ